MSDITLTFDTGALVAREQKLINNNQTELDYQVLKDSNYYCPHAEGDLKASARVDKPGLIIWDIAYARRRYYEKANLSFDKNINARIKWFEEAKAVRMKVWEKTAQGNI